MQSKESRSRVSLFWLALAALIVAALYFSFSLDNDFLGKVYLRMWTLRFLGGALLCLCLGMSFRNAVVKVGMFSLLAVFAALGVGESYLDYRDAKNSGELRQSAVATEFADEFADKASDRRSVPAAPNDFGEEGGLDYYIFDKAQITKMNEADGVKTPEGFLTYKEEFTKDPVLGYRPVRKESKIASVKMRGDEVVYNVIYSLLPSGWRITPQNPAATEAVIFFGCSCTFGEGLNDADSFPYKVGEELGSRYQVFNFAFHGYGSHQMLAMIDHGFLDDIAKKYKKIHVFFTTIGGHEQRSAGKAFWDKDGPCYQVEDGKVVYKGTFNQNKNLLNTPRIANLNPEQKMLDLHIAIMQQADHEIREKYGARLNVVAWFGVGYVDVLREKGIPTLNLITLFGDKYRIKGDGHPNPYATTVVANEIVTYIRDGEESAAMGDKKPE